MQYAYLSQLHSFFFPSSFLSLHRGNRLHAIVYFSIYVDTYVWNGWIWWRFVYTILFSMHTMFGWDEENVSFYQVNRRRNWLVEKKKKSVFEIRVGTEYVLINNLWFWDGCLRHVQLRF